MPLRSESDLAKTFTALTSSCKKTGFAVTPAATSTAWIVPAGNVTTPVSGATPTPSGTCDGTTYTVRNSDTCQSIAVARGISVSGLLTANNLPAFCAKFPISGLLCIPTAERCRVYNVKSGDTCVSIADANKLTWAQLVSWNLVLGADCSNIAANVGYLICISTPGGNWVNPSGGNDTPSPTPDTSTIVITGTDADRLPIATDMPMGNNTWVYKFAPLTRLDCVTYANSSTFGSSASCAAVARGFGVQETDLVTWNPSLQSACTLDGSQTYCVQRSIKNGSDTITPYCNLQDTALYNMRCDQFLAAWAIDVHRLDDLNPGVGKACENWKYGHNYCVSAPHFKPAGYASNCNKFAVADNTDQLVDPCAVMETQYGLSHARFVAWNPSVFQNCTGIVYGYDYCVSIPNYKPTYTSYVNTLVPMTANGPNAMKVEDAVATGFASSKGNLLGSKTTAVSIAATSSSIQNLHVHKHKRASKHRT
ncbi:hypothetical protein BKA63DRAFT_201695 [Paraphoma chrysanthemicola]|nr:hypothetical protein BKA63DRAFT_201695 [Paraphoma chrysanthemicola]